MSVRFLGPRVYLALALAVVLVPARLGLALALGVARRGARWSAGVTGGASSSR